MANPTSALGWLRRRTHTRLVGRLTSDSSWAACGESTVAEAGIDMAQSSAVPNPRIDIRVNQVCQQGDDDEREGEQEHAALPRGVGAGADRVDQQAADARPGE